MVSFLLDEVASEAEHPLADAEFMDVARAGAKEAKEGEAKMEEAEAAGASAHAAAECRARIHRDAPTAVASVTAQETSIVHQGPSHSLTAQTKTESGSPTSGKEVLGETGRSPSALQRCLLQS